MVGQGRKTRGKNKGKRNNRIKEAIESWNTIWEETKAFFPILYSYLTFVIIGTIGAIILEIIAPKAASGLLIKEEVTKLIIFIITAIIIGFFYLMHIISLTISTFGMIAKKEELRIKKIFSESKRIYWRTTRLYLLKIIMLTPIIILIPIIITLLTSTTGMNNLLVIIMTIVVIMILIIIYGGFYLYTDPILYLEDKKATATIKKAWQLFRKRKKFVWSNYLMLIIIALITGITSMIINNILVIIGMSKENPVLSIITIISSIISSAWTSTYLFKTYYDELLKE